MKDTAIQVEALSKQYRLGTVGTGTLVHDINRWWHRMLKKEDPYFSISEVNDRSEKGASEYVWSLKDINFSINHGEVVGVIGRNGAGKSTLLKILSRTTSPTTGIVKIKGRVASLLEVGTGFHPELTGRENIFLNGAILGMTKKEIRKKFDEIVDFSGVERYIDTPVKRYSSGMYVRLAFAVSAHLESEILIVDEVLAVGDAEFQKKCLGKMKDVSGKDGRTVLFVSHNMAAIENLCEKGIVLHNGRVHCIAEARQSIQSYLRLNENHATSTELVNRNDRQGTGILKFAEIQLLDGQTKQPIGSAASGQDIVIRLVVHIKPGISLGNVLFAIGLNDMFDNRICHLNNELTNQLANNLNGPLSKVDIAITNLPLNSGLYNLTVFTSINGEISDWVQNAFYFSVEGGDFYKSGKTIPGNAGTFLMNYNFSFTE